jgi:hypothetical protein
LLPLKLIYLFLILFFSASISLADSVEKEIPPKDYKWGLSVYGGLLFQESLDEITKGTSHIREHSYNLVVAPSRELWRFKDGFGFELEGQIVRHFDYMNHWVFNGLLVSRW